VPARASFNPKTAHKAIIAVPRKIARSVFFVFRIICGG